jgi:hypothetical protein
MRSDRYRDRQRILWRGVAAALATFWILIPPQQVLAAGGAFVVDDSEIGSPGDCKVEGWGAFASNRDFIGVAAPACVFNIVRPVEVGAQFVRFRSGGEWATDLLVKGKTSLVPLGDRRIGVGAIGGAAYSFTRDELVAVFGNLPVSFQISEPLRFNVNVGFIRNLVDTRTLITWGAGADFSLSEKITLIGEVFGFNSETGAQAGIRYTPHERIDFDLIYGRNLTGERADWVTFGVNLRF